MDLIYQKNFWHSLQLKRMKLKSKFLETRSVERKCEKSSHGHEGVK